MIHDFGGYEMEENTKRVVMIVVVVACFALAGVIVYETRSGGGGLSVKSGSMIWLKCNNPACGNEFPMQEKEYLKLIKGKLVVGLQVVPPLVCPKCSQESAYRAFKCEKCGKVFFPNTVQGKFDDICPGCGFSKVEERAKAAAAAPAPSE
jgi:DNA-directed RNA polymerase subunit RPC12/RpoP